MFLSLGAVRARRQGWAGFSHVCACACVRVYVSGFVDVKISINIGSSKGI
jgi:hypothetical protein